MTIVSTVDVLSGVVGVSSCAAIVVETLLTLEALYFLTADLKQQTF
jgi:hypothetical protein